jgi:uncharacterized membrane protein YhhN
MILVGLYLLIVLALMAAELKQDKRAQYFFKPLSALGFLLLAIQFGALDTDFGRLIFVALIACAIGDVFLLSRNNHSFFKTGMVAFAIGHVLYILAAKQIISQNLSVWVYFGSWAFGLMTGLATFYFLKSKLPKDMVWSVGLYTLIISAMLVYALQTDFVGTHKYFVLAAIFFALSDMFVARDRFVKPSPKNALIITPFYFGSQALFALSVTPL